jgi:ketosteroid isomerase-like protein
MITPGLQAEDLLPAYNTRALPRRSLMTRFALSRWSRWYSMFVVAAFTAACAPAAPPAPPDTRAADEAAIRTTDAAFASAGAAKDVAKVMSFYASDVVALPPNEPKADGHAAVQKMWEGLASAPGFAVSWQPVKVDVSGDLGYSVGTYSLTMNGPDGKPATDTGKYMEVWKRQADQSWKVVADMFNSDLPLPAPPAADGKKKAR